MREIVYHSQFEAEDKYWWFVARNRILEKTVRSFCDLHPNFNMLDVGCGTGGFATLLKDDCNVIGIDTSDTALSYSRKRGINNLHNCLLNEFDSSMYGTINAITMLDVIEHIEDDKSVVKDAYDLLPSGGIMIASVPAYQWLWSRHDEIHMHYRRYTIPNFKRLFTDAGFKVMYNSYYNSILLLPAVLKRIMDKITGGDQKNDAPIDEVPEFINSLFTKIFLIEKNWIPNLMLPFGLSIILVAKKM
ncbi:MAG: class I SAM-dependent methyltransferase [Candidatus Kapaibacterium sp.]|jgi:SAM-dependent methyltransferase